MLSFNHNRAAQRAASGGQHPDYPAVLNASYERWRWRCGEGSRRVSLHISASHLPALSSIIHTEEHSPPPPLRQPIARVGRRSAIGSSLGEDTKKLGSQAEEAFTGSTCHSLTHRVLHYLLEAIWFNALYTNTHSCTLIMRRRSPPPPPPAHLIKA